MARSPCRQTGPAMGIFQRLLEQSAGNPAVHRLLGQAYAQQEDYANSLTELQAALKLNPQLPEAHYYAGLAYLHQSNFENAAQEFRAELKVRPAIRPPATISRLLCCRGARLRKHPRSCARS